MVAPSSQRFRCVSVTYDPMGTRFLTNFLQIDDAGRDIPQGVSFTLYSPSSVWMAGTLYNLALTEVK